MILDTTVLVDLQVKVRCEEHGPATRLLEAAGDAPLLISFVTWMEFAEGFADDERSACESFLAAFRVLWPDADTAWRAARVSRGLQAAGAPIPDHDLWIAALAPQQPITNPVVPVEVLVKAFCMLVLLLGSTMMGIEAGDRKFHGPARGPRPSDPLVALGVESRR